MVYYDRVIRRAAISDRAQRQLRKLPPRIADKLLLWVEAVKRDGLETVRRIAGYHDEPLKGKRQGERAIRLSVHYRAIYRIVRDRDRTVEIAWVEEVTKHEY